MIKNKYDYEELLKAMEKEKKAQEEQQALLQQSQVAKNMASAGKDGAEIYANQQ